MSKTESHEDWEIYIESGKPLPDLRLIRYLLKQGARPLFVDLVGVTPLHRAVSRDNYLLCELLLQANADPNVHDFQVERTPLHLARSARVALLLMNYGADLNATNIVGWTPMQLAKKHKRESVMEEAIVTKFTKDELNRLGFPSEISHIIALYIVGVQEVENHQAQVEEVEDDEEEAKIYIERQNKKEAKEKKEDRKEAKEEVDQQSKIRKVREEEKKERKEDNPDDFAYALRLQMEEDVQSKRRNVREVNRDERREENHQDDFALALQLQEDLNAQWVERPNVGSNENDRLLARFLQEDEYAYL